MLAGLSFLLAWLTAGAVAAAAMDLDAYTVTRPGEILFERPARAQLLAALPPATRAAWCGPAPKRWRSHKAVTKIGSPEGDGPSGKSEPFAWSIMTAAAAAFGQDDGEAQKALIGNLRRWAKGQALTKLRDRHENTYYSIERTLLPTIVAFGLVRRHSELRGEERKLIERWLNRLVRLRGVKRPGWSLGEISQQNNHRYLSDSVDMAWGALRGDDALFRQGVESYVLALGQMRADGSLPLETARGAKALWYQRHAIASLVTIAEMAAVQGHDLYGLEVEGRTLHDAIGFLTRAVDDPTLVWPHAAMNIKAGEFSNYRVQDRTFLARRGHGRHYMAWVEIYAARFPRRAETRDLLRLLDAHDPSWRPMLDEYAGGATTCFFATP